MGSVDKRQKIAEELLSTERTYVEQLMALQRVYEEPLKKAEPSILPAKNIASIFSNLIELAQLNKEVRACINNSSGGFEGMGAAIG